MVYILFSWYLLYGFLKGSLFEQMKLAVLEKWEGVYNKGKNGWGTKYWGEYMYIKIKSETL